MHRRTALATLSSAILCAGFAPRAAFAAGPLMHDTFDNRPETRWRFFTDGVMGGVSTGQVAFLNEGGQSIARLTGEVSTANNGGFIQMRRALSDVPADAQGIRLIVRGNDARYYVHLRTEVMYLPWQHYRAGFVARDSWGEVRLPFAEFNAQGAPLSRTPAPETLTALGIVAYGADYTASLDIREVALY
ncbi:MULTISPECIES: CIA30 family protein [unclassified Roseivivax]|uniref:CIA30 family protein n=1 Tax=unclassified Roseivivax TaxID=2639302 RepID=UPI0015623259|nr:MULTISPECIES: CIA30 family protein [unclassified Roseivivax]